MDLLRHSRRSIRLPKFEYSSPGAYFVTICTKDRENLFGEIVDGEMRLNRVGEMVCARFSESVRICQEIEMDECVTMPDHMHFIIWIVGACATRPGLLGDENRGAWHAPLRKPKSLSSFVGLFKSKTTSIYRDFMNDNNICLWQRNYHERIIRNDEELNGIRQYIRNNPSNWQNNAEPYPL